MIVLHLVLLAILALPAATPQARPGGSVRGTVFKTDTAGPASGATVDLRRIGAEVAEVYSVQTSGDGTFQIANVPDGEYRLTAKHYGYVSAEFGQKRRTGEGIPLVIVAGQVLEDRDIELTPSGAMTGKLFDRDGDPMVTALVQALAFSYRDGKRVLQVVQSTYSNDLGEFRVFGLLPGRYFLSVTPLNYSGRTEAALLNASFITNSINLAGAISSASTGQAPIFYPGTSDVRAASPIDVAAGATVSGNNFSVAPAQRYHVRGTVSGSGVLLQLAPMNPSAGSPLQPRGFGPATESFDFPDVIPGDYMLIAQTADKEAKLRIDVRDADVNNVSLELRPGVVIPTHVTVDERGANGDNSNFRFIRFNLKPDLRIDGANGPVYSTFPDGTVNLDVTPGESYRISLFAVPNSPPEFQNIYIKSIQMGSRDVLNEGLQFNGEAGAKLEIVIGTKPGRLSGSVANARGRVSINSTVVLVPFALGRSRPDAYKVVTTDASGRFQFANVPPGEYTVFAWDDVDNGAWLDPDFLHRYEDLGKRIQIRESGTETITLQVIPAQ